MSDIVDKVLIDAKNNHFVNVNHDDPNIKALVAYAIGVGKSLGYEECKYIYKIDNKK